MMMSLFSILDVKEKSKIKANLGQNVGKYKFFTCSPEQSKYIDEYHYNCESLIVGTGGGVSFHYCNEPFSTSTDCLVFCSKDTTMLNIKWLYYYFCRHTSLLSSGFHGSGLKHVSKQYILNLKIDVPSISRQEEAVNRLDRLCHVETYLSNLLLKYDVLVKSQFVEMFGDCNLYRKDTSWEHIKNLGDVVGGSTPKTNNPLCWNGNYFWITPDEISDDAFVINKSNRLITEDGIKSCSLKVLPKGTVILSSRAPIGKLGIAGTSMYCNQGFKNIVCGNKLNPIYLFYLLKCNVNFLKDLGRGATFKEISKGIVENILIPCPRKDLQDVFALLYLQIDKSKFRVKQLQEKLETLYKALLQKYFG